MALDDKTIIQVDATVIVGLLILFSLSNITVRLNEINYLMLTIATSLSIIPFALSATYVILDKHKKAVDSMLSGFLGFVVIAGLMIGFAILNVIYVSS